MVPHDWINRNLRHNMHTNSHLFTICYQTVRVHTKKLRNSDQFAQAYEANVNKLTNDEPFLLLANNGYRAGTYPHAVVLSNVPHGLNCYTKYRQVVIDAALNPTHLHRKFLEDFVGMDERLIRRGLLSSVAYQTVMRSSLRMPEREDEVMLIVPDLDTAMDVRSYLPHVKLIAMGGRPKVHANATERKRAERARKKAQQQDNRQDNIA
jgi:hypothetical protein